MQLNQQLSQSRVEWREAEVSIGKEFAQKWFWHWQSSSGSDFYSVIQDLVHLKHAALSLWSSIRFLQYHFLIHKKGARWVGLICRSVGNKLTESKCSTNSRIYSLGSTAYYLWRTCWLLSFHVFNGWKSLSPQMNNEKATEIVFLKLFLQPDIGMWPAFVLDLP